MLHDRDITGVLYQVHTPYTYEPEEYTNCFVYRRRRRDPCDARLLLLLCRITAITTVLTAMDVVYSDWGKLLAGCSTRPWLSPLCNLLRTIRRDIVLYF